MIATGARVVVTARMGPGAPRFLWTGQTTAVVDALEYRIARRPAILIGQAPSRRSDPRAPLTGGRSGARLQELAGLSLAGYVRLFSRANLLARWPGQQGKGDRFPMRDARAGAEDLACAGLLSGRDVVFVGAKVAAAFGHDAPFLRWRRAPDGSRRACLPHPSGVNHWWNDPANAARARRFLRALARRARNARALRNAPTA